MRLNELDRYTEENLNPAKAVEIRNIPLSAKLKEKIAYHQDQINKIIATLALLETNKDIEKLLFLLNEVH